LSFVYCKCWGAKYEQIGDVPIGNSAANESLIESFGGLANVHPLFGVFFLWISAITVTELFLITVFNNYHMSICKVHNVIQAQCEVLVVARWVEIGLGATGWGE